MTLNILKVILLLKAFSSGISRIFVARRVVPLNLQSSLLWIYCEFVEKEK